MISDPAHPIKANGKRNLIFKSRYNGMQDEVMFSGSDDMFIIPCKRCIGCQSSYAKSWADRMLLELDHSKTAVFITLTYDNDHIPMVSAPETGEAFASLSVRDTQLFWKSLRGKFPYAEIRYFLAGEYGPKFHRPHYHAIVFGLDMMRDFPDIVERSRNEIGQPYYSSDILASCWGRGFVGISPVTYRTFAYVARYCMKKHYGQERIDFEDKTGRKNEFNTMSRNPGLGMYFLEEHGLEYNRFSMFDGETSKSVVLPSKLYEKLELTNPELYAILKEDRKQSALSSARQVLQDSSTDYITAMKMQESVRKDKSKYFNERKDV